ncbi:MAG TPA: DUF3667 domain-containing protein [Ohtaekwangia sp.]|nr:DUF3667 domain-containing protein [Ohtaekwangia sp.]
MSHKKYRQETNCLNCGSEVLGKFCQNCGQENIETRENFFHLVGHFIADYLHFDSKFFRSLIPLFTRPGFLTKEYWEGRRVRYIHPLRLFFFITIVFMIANSYFYHRYGDTMKKSMVRGDRMFEGLDTVQLSSLADTVTIKLANREDSITVRELRNNMRENRQQVAKLNAGIDMVFTNLKYITFFLLPVYALVFKLIYIRRKSYYVDHVVYTLHLQTFVYVLFAILMLLPFLFSISLENVRRLAALSIVLYVGFSLHYLYRQAWWKTILKSVIATFLLFFVTIAAIIVIALADAFFIH